MLILRNQCANIRLKSLPILHHIAIEIFQRNHSQTRQFLVWLVSYTRTKENHFIFLMQLILRLRAKVGWAVGSATGPLHHVLLLYVAVDLHKWEKKRTSQWWKKTINSMHLKQTRIKVASAPPRRMILFSTTPFQHSLFKPWHWIKGPFLLLLPLPPLHYWSGRLPASSHSSEPYSNSTPTHVSSSAELLTSHPSPRILPPSMWCAHTLTEGSMSRSKKRGGGEERNSGQS